jgi:hypothetical protein
MANVHETALTFFSPLLNRQNVICLPFFHFKMDGSGIEPKMFKGTLFP